MSSDEQLYESAAHCQKSGAGPAENENLSCMNAKEETELDIPESSLHEVVGETEQVSETNHNDQFAITSTAGSDDDDDDSSDADQVTEDDTLEQKNALDSQTQSTEPKQDIDEPVLNPVSSTVEQPFITKIDDSKVIELLKTRDLISNNFRHLFITEEQLRSSKPNDDERAPSSVTNILEKCKKQLVQSESKVKNLEELIKDQKKEVVHLQDEMLSMNIENNILHAELQKNRNEYDKLVERWMAKAQQDADTMNATLT